MRRSTGLVALLLVTAANGVASQPPPAATAQVADAAAPSGATRAVFPVHTEYGKATGFLVDAGGIVLTDVRILRDAKRLRVQVDDSTKVAAQLLARHDQLGVAAFGINPATCAELPVLELAAEVSNPPATADPLVPLQSGRPLLDEAGTVQGMLLSTRPDAEGQPLPSRVVSAAALRQPLAEARARLRTTKPPSSRRYPVVPRELFPQAQLEAAGSTEKWDRDPYRISDLNAAGRYVGYVYTPPLMYQVQVQAEADLAERLRKADADETPDTSLYDPFARLGIRDLKRRTYAPVVTIEVTPQLTITERSNVRREMAATIGDVIGAIAGVSLSPWSLPEYEFEFAADLVSFDLRVDGKRVEDLTRGTAWLPLEQVARGNTGDVGAVGVFVYDARVFLPRDGSWPTIDIIIESTDKPGTWRSTRISQRTLERVALDFEPWLLQQRAREWDRSAPGDSAGPPSVLLRSPRTGEPCRLSSGMPISRLRELLGEPARVTTMLAGGAKGRPWHAVVHEYEAGRDPLYRSHRRQLVNRLVFELANLDTVLAFWESEAPTP